MLFRSEARHPQMRDSASGVHPDILEHLPRKITRVCLLYCLVLSPLISLGAVSHHLTVLGSAKSRLFSRCELLTHSFPAVSWGLL